MRLLECIILFKQFDNIKAIGIPLALEFYKYYFNTLSPEAMTR
jgi:hypothetical protein